MVAVARRPVMFFPRLIRLFRYLYSLYTRSCRVLRELGDPISVNGQWSMGPDGFQMEMREAEHCSIA